MSAPLRATIIEKNSSYGAERNTFGWEHHLNIAISLAIHYLPSPLRSVPQSLVQAGQAGRQAGRQAGKQAGRQAGRQAERQAAEQEANNIYKWDRLRQ